MPLGPSPPLDLHHAQVVLLTQSTLRHLAGCAAGYYCPVGWQTTPAGYGWLDLLCAANCVFVGGAGTLVFSHRVSGTGASSDYFASLTQAASYTAENVSATVHKFSILNNLESYRSADGTFRFQVVYPSYTAGPNGKNYNEFTQTSNPVTATAGVGAVNFVALSTAYNISAYIPDGVFSGLRKSAATTATLLDCEPNGDVDWYYAVGSIVNWNNGIPGPPDTAVTWVQVYVNPNCKILSIRIGSTSCKSVCANGTYSTSGSASCQGLHYKLQIRIPAIDWMCCSVLEHMFVVFNVDGRVSGLRDRVLLHSGQLDMHTFDQAV